MLFSGTGLDQVKEADTVLVFRASNKASDADFAQYWYTAEKGPRALWGGAKVFKKKLTEHKCTKAKIAVGTRGATGHLEWGWGGGLGLGWDHLSSACALMCPLDRA